MRVIPIRTGTVRIRQRMQRGVRGPLRRVGMFTGPWTEVLPILTWAIEHPEGVIVVDTGEHAEVRDAPFARFEVIAEEEIGPGLRGAGIDPRSVPTVVLTHLHGDHIDGLHHLPNARVLASTEELRFAATPGARLIRRLTHQPLPDGFDPVPVTFDGPAIGAFPASHALTAAGDVVLVPTPGHTPGHMSVLVVEQGRHLLLAGDTTDDQPQLLDRAVDAIAPKAAVSRGTMDTILRHARLHPTVYLPAHDPDSVARLEAETVLPA
jgi:N-acyl homoserine lactone hydrolase